MNAYTVINNPHLSVPLATPNPERFTSGDALNILSNRQFHVMGNLVLHALDYIDPLNGGGFVTGKEAPKRVARLRRSYPTIPLVIEPLAFNQYVATQDDPFRIDVDENELFAPSLDAALDLQRLAGSDLVVTPTGQIRVGDSATLKEALVRSNDLERADVILGLPLEAGWLSDPLLVTQIIRVLDRSRHPVALAFAHRTNPLASKKRLRAYRRIFEETTGAVIAYRTDLAGLDARARGAIAAAIGANPSARRLTPVGTRGHAIDPTDLAPHMLVGDMLRFVRSKYMRNVWFAEAPAFQCFCVICRGADVDRLFGDSEDRITGHLHNVRELGRLHATTIGLAQAQRAVAWAAQVAGAKDTYPQLESHIGASLLVPADVTVWS